MRRPIVKLSPYLLMLLLQTSDVHQSTSCITIALPPLSWSCLHMVTLRVRAEEEPHHSVLRLR